MTTPATLWISRILTALITLAIAATATMKIAGKPKLMLATLTQAGIPESAVIPISLVELTCLALYLIPQTTVLGAVLLTGYLGGAIVVHIITHQSAFPPFLLGMMAWGGIYFHIPALQSLLPLR
jgi:hypothetical protein